MTYSVTILRRAQKELRTLPGEAYVRIRDAIRGLGEDPRPPGCLKLTGRDHRVLYEIDDSRKLVAVLHIGHRRDVYR